MRESTRTLVLQVLDADPECTPELKTAVQNLLAGHAPLNLENAEEISERQAAALLGIHVMTMNRWRRGKCLGKAFPFTVRQTPGGNWRYIAAEVRSYRVRSYQHRAESAPAADPAPATTEEKPAA